MAFVLNSQLHVSHRPLPSTLLHLSPSLSVWRSIPVDLTPHLYSGRLTDNYWFRVQGHYPSSQCSPDRDIRIFP